MAKTGFYFLIAVLLSFSINAQTGKLSGIIYDAQSQEPLAFVSVLIKGTGTGVITDIDGRFQFAHVEPETVLLISYIGYKAREYIPEKNPPSVLSIAMERDSDQMENVIIQPGENPAHRIIRLLQRNRKLNDPEYLPSFKYNAYTVAALGTGERLWNSARRDTVRKSPKQVKKKNEKKDAAADSLAAKLWLRFKENYIFLTESYTQCIFLYPGQIKETVLATKVSGIKSASFAITGSSFQPFGFYKDYLEMNGKIYTSPIINGSSGMYKFRLTETLVHENDTSFIISFEPRGKKNFNGLKGILYINSNGYALENVIAWPAEEKELIMSFRIQQKYERMQKGWFPVQLNATISQKDIKADSVLTYWDSRCYISNIVIGDTISRNEFSDVILDYHPMAGKQPDTAWNRMRSDSLTRKEQMTYETFEMLPAKAKRILNKSNALIEALAIEGFSFGNVNIPFKYFLSGINEYEKFRLGAGFQTNQIFSKRFSLGGFSGYGLGDKAWKYGANLAYNFHERTVTSLNIEYSRDLAEPGTIDYFLRNGSIFSNQSLRNFLIARLDSIRLFRVSFGTKIRPFLQTDIWLRNELRGPAGYAYQFKDDLSNRHFRQFHNTEVGAGLRYSHGESFTSLGRAKIKSRQATTELLMQLSGGMKHFLNGDLSYIRTAISFSHSFRLKRFGQTTFQIDGMQVLGKVPYSYLFNISGSYSSRLSVYLPNSFQTAGLYEFISDKKVSVFVQHNFERLLFRPKNISIRPEILLVQNICYGSLNNPSFQKNIEFKIPAKGLYESGLLVTNLYRKNIRFCYLGFGGGVFYRYGYYAFDKNIDNYAFKFVITFSF